MVSIRITLPLWGFHQIIKLLPALLLLSAVSVLADSLDISASERGWVCSGSACSEADNFGQSNGDSAGNDYFAGSDGNGDELRDWFELSIPTLTGGTLTSATLELDEPATDPAPGHAGGSLTFVVYRLSAASGTTVDITLNAAALAAIGAAQGGNIFIGGIDSGKLSFPSFAGDFAFTDSDYSTVLQLQTTGSGIPEPNLVGLLTVMLVVLSGGIGWRKRIKKPAA
jgi:hypothetical protein